MFLSRQPARGINNLNGNLRHQFGVFRWLLDIVGYSFGYNWVQNPS
jgi:hypothetical protein